MPTFSLWFDLLCAVLTYTIALLGTLLWVFRSGQSYVAASPETTRRVTIRIALIVVFVTMACYIVNVAFFVPLAILGMLILAAAIAGDLFGIIALPAIALGYVIKEFVLGFPQLILEPPEPAESRVETEHPLQIHVGQTAQASTPLKPNGEVELNQERFPAASESGDFIDRDASVIVVGVRNGTLLVREQRRTSSAGEA